MPSQSDGASPLWMASQFGYTTIVNLLLKAGSNVNCSMRVRATVDVCCGAPAREAPEVRVHVRVHVRVRVRVLVALWESMWGRRCNVCFNVVLRWDRP